MASTDEARCPIRIGDPCSLCHPGAGGPETCGLVYLVMCDPELRDELLRRWARWEQETTGEASVQPRPETR
ncbi:DUF6767 domain-containing protein [Nocardioides pakistanensis]